MLPPAAANHQHLHPRRLLAPVVSDQSTYTEAQWRSCNHPSAFNPAASPVRSTHPPPRPPAPAPCRPSTPAFAFAATRCGATSARPSSRRSPTLTRATSPPTSFAGSQFGYRLLWVLLWSNAMAIVIQYLSAKLGIVTGLTLPAELPPPLQPAHHASALGRCRDLRRRHRPRRVPRRRARPRSAHRPRPPGTRPLARRLAVHRRSHRHRRRLRHPRARSRRLPVARARHHGAGRHHRHLLRL